MSRSFRHTPIFSWTGSDSDRYYKKKFHKLIRAKTRLMITHLDEDTYLIPLENECYDVWCSNKEHRWYNSPYDALYADNVPYYWCLFYKTVEEVLEEDRERYKKGMRK